MLNVALFLFLLLLKTPFSVVESARVAEPQLGLLNPSAGRSSLGVEPFSDAVLTTHSTRGNFAKTFIR